MQFEWLGVTVFRRVEAERDGLCVLVGSVEGVVQVHEEGVALPPRGSS